jgi:hypothetical protein
MFEVGATASAPAGELSSAGPDGSGHHTASQAAGHEAACEALRLQCLQEFATGVAPELFNAFAFISGALQLQAVELGVGMDDLPWFKQAMEMANKGAAKSRDLLDYAGRHARETNRAPVTDVRPLLLLSAAGGDPPSQRVLPDDLWPVVCHPAVVTELCRVVYGAADAVGIARSELGILAQNVPHAELGRFPAFAARVRDYVRLCITMTTPAPCPFDLRHVLTPQFMLRPTALPVLHLAADYARIRRAGGDLIVRQVAGSGSGPVVVIDLLLPRAKWLSADWYQPPGDANAHTG